MMRVGYLALQAPGLSPSQRYRVEAFAAKLRERDITISYEWVLDATDLRVFYGRAPLAQKAAVAARAFVRRLDSLATRPAPDVWLVQREAFFLGNHWAEWLAARRAPVVFDFDDAIWIRAVSAANSRYAWLKNVDKIARITALADTVLAGNQYLADWAAGHAARVQVVPTCVDTDHFRPPPARDDEGPIVIGWSGSPSTLDHLRPLLPVLERLTRHFGPRVSVRVMGDPSFAHTPMGLRGEAWTPDAELALLQRMDIGLMPLPDDAWTRGKCGLKGLVAMAVGAATVMSPVGVNTTIVRHGENGFLAAGDDEWFDVLSRLVDDADLRARVAAAGRQTVVDDYSVARWAPALGDVLDAAATRGRVRR
jgi:glycosyltransferase involved in cell wall biosynthesis